MPHKHKRRADPNIEDTYDLPPTTRARPLGVGRQSTAITDQRQRKGTNSSHNGSGNYGKNDTPRAFQRLLQYQKTGRGISSGLDMGEGKRSKKRKRDDVQSGENISQPAPSTISGRVGPQKEAATATSETQQDQGTELRIQPNERFTDFIARVDQALPLAGISTKGKKVVGIKERRTKHDKRLRKLQDGWRAEEARLREREEEEREAAEDAWEEQLAGLDREGRAVAVAVQRAGVGAKYGSGTSAAKTKGKKSSKKKKQGDGEMDVYAAEDDDDEDPWAVLNERREAPKGVFDVAQAPPTFKKLPRELFKANDVPKNAGSLRKREELGQTRADIIKNYRAIMAQKRS